MTAIDGTRAVQAPGGTFGGALRSEWIKLRSLRSSVWCAVIILVLGIGLAALIGAALPSAAVSEAAGTDARQQLALGVITASANFTALVAAVLGALTISGEYGTGMIRSTFAAVPARLPALVAKATVVAVATFLVGAVSLVGSALVITPLLAAKDIPLDLGDGRLWAGMLGGALYLALIALFAFGLGTIIRNSAGAIATAIGVIFVLPLLAQLAYSLSRAEWVMNAMAFLPTNAGSRLSAYPEETPAAIPGSTAIILEPWQGGLVMAAWAVVAVVVGLILAKRRDV